jgi:hypothetical protein
MYYLVVHSRLWPFPLMVEHRKVSDLADLFYKWDMKSIKTITDNPLIIHSVLTWFKLHELFRREGLIPLKPLYGTIDCFPCFSRTVTLDHGLIRVLLFWNIVMRREFLCPLNCCNSNTTCLTRTPLVTYNLILSGWISRASGTYQRCHLSNNSAMWTNHCPRPFPMLTIYVCQDYLCLG